MIKLQIKPVMSFHTATKDYNNEIRIYNSVYYPSDDDGKNNNTNLTEIYI